ncbi:transposase [Rhodococcus opacus]|uniref:transposase n=1 Tax=Rhodococcus opacus TaxID=37919 RepID=UPI0002E90F34
MPTESSSGASRSQRSIAKSGNARARRPLIEAVWASPPPLPSSPGVDLRRGWNQATPSARAHGQHGNRR